MNEQLKGPLDDLLASHALNLMNGDADDDGKALYDHLVARYGLMARGEGDNRLLVRGPGHTDDQFTEALVDLLNDSLYYAADALRRGALRFGEGGQYQPHHLDDSGDYDNAAVFQIQWILGAFQDAAGDPMRLWGHVLGLLNASSEAVDGIHDESYAFKLGFADHFTPISTLARMNWDED